MRNLLILFVIGTLLVGCAPAANQSQDGARKGMAIGALVGAGVGAVAGDGKGALIGMGVGALVGGFAGKKIGQQMDEQEAMLQKQLADAKAAEIRRTADMLTVTFRSDYLFAVNSAELKPGAEEEVKRVSTVLNQYPLTEIRVAGHTDSTGSAELNQHLSEQRALSVKKALVQQGVHPARVQTIGFGAEMPLADNGTIEGRQLNRRVVVTIEPTEDS